MSLDPNVLTILVADDDIATQHLLKKSLTKLGHSIIIADDGLQAVELYQQHKPDIMLCDINMPVMNGLEAIKAIRTLPSKIWLPILILSASEQDKDIIKGLESGADDYLAKPINLNVLYAKIDVMQRMVNLQQNNNAINLKLNQANMELEQEQIVAKHLADKMLGMSKLEDAHIDYWLCPNKHFSGDLIATSYSRDGVLYIMLADSTGHGLAASLPTFTVARTFHAMTKKGFNLASIVQEMNITAKSLLTADRFVAANVFAINFDHRTIESWCGGIPDSFIVDEQGEIIHRLSSEHLAIGILPDQIFDATTQIYHWQQPISLIAYTDGLADASNADNEVFGVDKLEQLIHTTAETRRISTIKQAVLEHIDSDSGHDDMSIVSIQCRL